jgi:3'-phosphoadenosine 5'-phosphosulfate sulfotransferase (PAPS reductase)/FAD synthetase
MPLSELAIKEKIGELQRESMSAAEKIIALEQKEQRERLIDWIKTDPEVKIIIAFSGGKDSIYMVLFYLYVLHIPPDRIELWHHDVDGHGEELFDWKSTPEYCMAFARAFNLKLLFSYRKGGIVGRLLRNNEPLGDVFYQSEPGGEFHCAKSDPNKLNTGGRWMQVGSDMKKRWCSSSVKIEVASRILTNDQRLQGSPERPVKIVFNTGERHDESTARKNLKEVEVYRGTRLVSTRNVILFRPNVSISEQQVWQMMKAHRVQPHPCYMIGLSILAWRFPCRMIRPFLCSKSIGLGGASIW